MWFPMGKYGLIGHGRLLIALYMKTQSAKKETLKGKIIKKLQVDYNNN